MREIRTSGSTRGEWAAPQGVALSPTLLFIGGLILSHVLKLLAGQGAALAAEGEVDGKSYEQPDEEAEPCQQRQPHHQDQAAHD
jgi:hypothetical protein